MALQDIYKLTNGTEIWVLKKGSLWVSAFVGKDRAVLGTANFDSRESLISKVIRADDVASHSVIAGGK